jgi:lipid-A-disaccharide synthase
VIYYISPQVWAWRKGRVRTIARVVDRMLVLFPFELEFYRQHGVEVTHVGHPLIDEVPQLPQVWDRPEEQHRPYVISLLPGSRASEVRALLPRMLRSAELLAERLPVHIRLIQAATVDPDLIAGILATSDLEIEAIHEDRFTAIAQSHLAICASGTATVEVGLLGTPMIVVYRVAFLTWMLGKMLLDLPHVSMVNLVLAPETGEPVVPELLQKQGEPEQVATEAARLLTEPEAIPRMRRALADLRPRLGAGGASRRAAEEVARRL